MKNLVRNSLRSLKNNKISIVGLVFLIFFGLGAFCTMSNTTANIKNEYTSISSQGRLHDFTVSELYDAGNAAFSTDSTGTTRGIEYTRTNPGALFDTDTAKIVTVEDFAKIQTTVYYHNNERPDTGTYYIPLPVSEHIGESTGPQTYRRTYDIQLNKDLSTGLYSKYAQNEGATTYTHFKVRISNTFETPEAAEDSIAKDYYDLTKDESKLEDNLKRIVTEANAISQDFNTFTDEVNNQSRVIYNAMMVNDTPLTIWMKSKESEFADDIEFKFFKSMNVTATDDKTFYKVIDSNIEDQIDKIVLFKDKNNRTGNNLFSLNDCAPFGSEIVFYDKDGNKYQPGTMVDNIKVPASFNEVALFKLYSSTEIEALSEQAKILYSQIVHIRFKRMYAGNRSTNKLDDLLNVLAAVNLDAKAYFNEFKNSSSALRTDYNSYINTWVNTNSESVVVSANGNIVFQWIELLGTPQTCTINNWTAEFSVLNPQYLAATDKRVFNPNVLNDFEPFKQWHKAVHGSEHGGEISNDIAKQWLNTLTYRQFFFWMNPESLGAGVNEMTYDLPNGLKITITKGSAAGQWNGIDKKYISSCGGNNQIIWGCGVSPDFMYPVVDISRPTPNAKTEVLLYCNEAGYGKIKLAFFNSPTEQFVAGRFKSGVSSSRRKSILAKINAKAKEIMIWPKDIKCAYFADDESNLLNCAGLRVAYIPKLLNTVNTASIILCSFIAILALVICFVIIKRYVERNRVNIGIMRANGIKKSKIALSLFPFALIPAIIGGIGAYLLGFFLQAPMLILFKNYWTLPTPLLGFDWISMVVCILLPFLIFGLISFIATMVVLRTKAVELMKPGSEFKTNGFSRVIKRPFKHTGILTRFRVSLAFNSITRLLMMSAMSCLTMASLVFAFTTFDKLNKSRIINSSQFDYNFSLQLTTPTASGSTYSTYNYDLLGAVDENQYLFNINWDTTEGGTKQGSLAYPQMTRWYSDGSNDSSVIEFDGKSNGNLMLPSASDMNGQNLDPMYLADKVSAKMTLDYNLGASFIGATSNPWEIALSLMPANSRNLAADSFNKIINKVGAEVAKATTIFEAEYPVGEGERRSDVEKANAAAAKAGKWCFVENGGTLLLPDYYNSFGDFFTTEDKGKTYKLTKHDWLTGFSKSFTKLIVTMYRDKEIIEMEYPIMYRQIPINWGYDESIVGNRLDELYTYVNANITGLSTNAKFDNSSSIKIEGIKNNSNYIKLTNDKGKSINSLLFSDKDAGKDNTYPLIANAFAAHKYKLNVGSTIDVKIENMVDRYNRKLHPEQFTDNSDTAKFKIVGISAGTNGEAYYTSQECANKMIGLPDGKSWNRTHRYMLWQEKGLAADTPQLIDLAGIGSSDQSKMTRYTFTNSETEFTKPTTDFEVAKKNLTPPTGFNGIYTKNTSGKPLTGALSLYSYTGMYLGASVYKASGSNNKFTEILMNNANLGVANLMTGIEDPEYYKACNDYLNSRISAEDYKEICNKFIEKVVKVYGETTMVTAICGAMDVAASDLVYKNLITTFNLAETSIMAIIIPITIIIVGIISNLIIADSKKMAAMLKALGYSDGKNLMSILAMFIPTIILGLILAVPLSFGLTKAYQSVIFAGANILVDVTQHWWFYIGALGGIGLILLVSYAIGYASLKRSRLVDQIK